MRIWDFGNEGDAAATTGTPRNDIADSSTRRAPGCSGISAGQVRRRREEGEGPACKYPGSFFAKYWITVSNKRDSVLCTWPLSLDRDY